MVYAESKVTDNSTHLGNPSRAWVNRARAYHGRIVCSLVLGLSTMVPAPGFALTPLERDLKKVERYFDDNFCEDALNLAKDLKATKEGNESFDVWMALIRGTYCLHDVNETLSLINETQRSVKMDSTQNEKLRTFLNGKILTVFGELRFELPDGKTGKVEVQLNKAGPFVNPELEPFYEFSKKKLAEGVEIPYKVLLPFGSYEIDQAERTIDEPKGIGFVIGKEKLGPWKKTQVGDGQSVGFGWSSFFLHEGTPYRIKQQSGSTITLVDAQRLSMSGMPILEISSTSSSPFGTIGMIGRRIDFRVRPPVTGLPGEVDPTLPASSFYSLGALLTLELPAAAGISMNFGVGGRFGLLSNIRYVFQLEGTAVSEGEDVGDLTVNTLTVVPLSAYQFGPEALFTAGRSIRLGKGGLQFGIAVAGMLDVTRPVSGRIQSSTCAEGVLNCTFNIAEVPILFGPLLTTSIYLRVPFF